MTFEPVITIRKFRDSERRRSLLHFERPGEQFCGELICEPRDLGELGTLRIKVSPVRAYESSDCKARPRTFLS